jgi:hypothetical protein
MANLYQDKFNTEEIEEKLRVLEHINGLYYERTQRVGIHSFIEHTGLMIEHLKLLRLALKAGIDPEHVNGFQGIVMPGSTARYIGERFAYIFAPFFTLETWQEFCDEVSKKITHPGS